MVHRKLVGPQNQYGHFGENSLAWPGINSTVIQTAA